jgi:hypothetical protein
MQRTVSADGCGLQQVVQVTSLHNLGEVNNIGQHPPQHHQSAIVCEGGMVGDISGEQFEGVGD